jgi:two-component system sensor histidine kinase DesK
MVNSSGRFSSKGNDRPHMMGEAWQEAAERFRELMHEDRLSLQSRASSLGFVAILYAIAIYHAHGTIMLYLATPSFLTCAICSLLVVPGRTLWKTVPMLSALAIGLLTWIAVCVEGSHHALGMGLPFLGAMALTLCPKRGLMTTVLLIAMMVPPLLLLPNAITDMERMRYAFMQVGVCALLTGILVIAASRQRLFDQERHARQLEADITRQNERNRMAHDLHDIQGHTLHVVNFTIAAALVLIPKNPDAASEKLKQAQSMIINAIQQTNDIIFEKIDVNLGVEISNAVSLLEATGITCCVNVDGHPRSPEEENVAAHVVREGTTNILRHADATKVRLLVQGSDVLLENDGVDMSAPIKLRGLAALKNRVEEQNGTFLIDTRNGWFHIAASFNRAGAQTEKKATVA